MEEGTVAGQQRQLKRGCETEDDNKRGKLQKVSPDGIDYFTSKQTFPHTIKGETFQIIILNADNEIDNEVKTFIDACVSFRAASNPPHSRLIYISSFPRIIIKLNDGTIFSGIKENITLKSSKFVSFDDRWVSKKNKKHLGVYSLFRYLLQTAIRKNPKISELPDRLAVFDAAFGDDSLKLCPPAKIKKKPCPSTHQVCRKKFNDNSDANIVALKNHSYPPQDYSTQDGSKRPFVPCCLNKKIVYSEWEYDTLSNKNGVYPKPFQFDKLSLSFREAKSQGKQPWTYSLDQILRTREKDKQFLPLAQFPTYSLLYSPQDEEFKACELVHGSFLLTGFYIESSDKVTLQFELRDMLVTPLEGRTSESDNIDGIIDFDLDEIKAH